MKLALVFLVLAVCLYNIQALPHPEADPDPQYGASGGTQVIVEVNEPGSDDDDGDDDDDDDNAYNPSAAPCCRRCARERSSRRLRDRLSRRGGRGSSGSGSGSGSASTGANIRNCICEDPEDSALSNRDLFAWLNRIVRGIMSG